MRLRNVKKKEEILNQSKLLIENPEQYKGKWNQVFGNENPIHIEIGMGKGKFIVEMAKRYPNVNFIGIEKYDSVLVRALEKEDNLANLRMLRRNALVIDRVFSKEITTIYLNFSDPWPKRRHHERRLTSSIFLEKYGQLLKEDGRIIQKTDNQDLFCYSLVSLSQFGYVLESVTLDLAKLEEEENVLTEYEERFMKQGLPIYRLIARKRK